MTVDLSPQDSKAASVREPGLTSREGSAPGAPPCQRSIRRETLHLLVSFPPQPHSAFASAILGAESGSHPSLQSPLLPPGSRPRKPGAEEAEVGLGEGAHIWIPGPEPTFLPCECEEMGSRGRPVRRLLAPVPPHPPHCNRGGT